MLKSCHITFKWDTCCVGRGLRTYRCITLCLQCLFELDQTFDAISDRVLYGSTYSFPSNTDTNLILFNTEKTTLSTTWSYLNHRYELWAHCYLRPHIISRPTSFVDNDKAPKDCKRAQPKDRLRQVKTIRNNRLKSASFNLHLSICIFQSRVFIV